MIFYKYIFILNSYFTKLNFYKNLLFKSDVPIYYGKEKVKFIYESKIGMD